MGKRPNQTIDTAFTFVTFVADECASGRLFFDADGG